VQLLAGMHRTLLLVLCASFVTSVILLTVISKVGGIGGLVSDDAENGNNLFAQDATPAQSASASTQNEGIIPADQNEEIIPADRMTTWSPGLNAVGGIPNRTTIYQTLSPRGGSLDDTAVIQRAGTCNTFLVAQLWATSLL
jgi:hypothetical protein